MLRRTAKPGMLRGLDENSVIQNGDTTGTRHTTRQAVHGRQDALYDIKYHPMDDFVRPASAARHYQHALQAADSDDEDHGTSERGSDSENESENANEDERRLSKRQRVSGTRHSKRAGARKRVNYNTQVHPQDDLLREVDRGIVEVARPVKSRARKPVVLSIEDSESGEASEVDIEVSRAALLSTTHCSPGAIIANSISPSIVSSSHAIVDELYPPTVPPGDHNTRPWAPALPRSSLVAYSSSEDSDDDAKPSEATRSNAVIFKYSSDVTFSSQYSVGQRRRARAEEIMIYQDSETENDISLVQRAVTEYITRETDFPKENEDARVDGAESDNATSDGEFDLLGVEPRPAQSVPTFTASDDAVEEALNVVDEFIAADVGTAEDPQAPAVADITLTSSVSQPCKPPSTSQPQEPFKPAPQRSNSAPSEPFPSQTAATVGDKSLPALNRVIWPRRREGTAPAAPFDSVDPGGRLFRHASYLGEGTVHEAENKEDAGFADAMHGRADQ